MGAAQTRPCRGAAGTGEVAVAGEVVGVLELQPRHLLGCPAGWPR